MLGGEERHDLVPRDGVAEVGDEMAEVILLLRADGVVGHQHADVVTRQRLDRVVGIYPRVHTFRRRQLRPRRTELNGDYTRRLAA
jgi:hypothetical protein